jgi:hypothetical protein
MTLNRDQIFSAPKAITETVPVPEWGGDVIVRSISALERDEFESSMAVKRGRSIEVNIRNIRARLVAIAAVDEDGKRLFSDKDVEQLGELSAKAMDRVYEVAARLSGISERDAAEIAGN